jgi:hypothetical protein
MMNFKKKHEDVARLHSQDGGMPMKHNHEAVADLHKVDGGMPMQHHHEAVTKLCGGGMPKGRK